MISHLRGKIYNSLNFTLTLETNGVGYEVFVTKKVIDHLKNENDEVFILTYLDVKETSMVLYGFFDDKEREVFKLLITVNGISCKTAHSILTNIGFEQIIRLIANNDSHSTIKIPGIGPKKIELISLALKDKILKLSSMQSYEEIYGNETGITNNEQIRLETLTALMNLGYTRMEGEKIIREVLKQNPGKDFITEELIKKSLELVS